MLWVNAVFGHCWQLLAIYHYNPIGMYIYIIMCIYIYINPVVIHYISILVGCIAHFSWVNRPFSPLWLKPWSCAPSLGHLWSPNGTPRPASWALPEEGPRFHSHGGYPQNGWLRENPPFQMIPNEGEIGGTPISGNHHLRALAEDSKYSFRGHVPIVQS